MSRILIMDDEISICRTLKLHLKRQGHTVEIRHDATTGLEIFKQFKPHIVILDIRMPGMNGLDVIPLLTSHQDHLAIIMITAFHDMETTIQAMQRGAMEYIHKPIDIGELDSAVRRAQESHPEFEKSHEGEMEVKADHHVSGSNTLIGGSAAMKNIFKSIGLVCRNPPTAFPVLLQGESGTGKELVARQIHQSSVNREEPFVAVNCAALVDTLLESEMFGHEKGAFTGAVVRKEGKFAQSGQGTLFLDEVGDLSSAIQAKLLRVLQERCFERVGGHLSLEARCRIIAATNRNLPEKVAAGDFREDLYYRLGVITLHLPPLRERREDIPALVRHLLIRITHQTGRRRMRIQKQAMDLLIHAPWPGNVRQLENTLMKSVALSQGEQIFPADLPDEIRDLSDAAAVSVSVSGVVNSDAHRDCDRNKIPEEASQPLVEVEREHIDRILQKTGWHKGKACAILGISRPRLDRKIHQYGLRPSSST